MDVSFDRMSPSEVYFNMTQTLIPRPIACLLSENPSGSFNVAPFSYFTAVSSNPPLIMISVGKRPDGTHKDTRVNIEERGHFIVHIASSSQMNELSESSASLPLGDFSLPRIANCPVAYGCDLYELREMGEVPQSLIFGRIKSLYIDDGVCTKDGKGRLKADAGKIDPLARLGANEYSRLDAVTTCSRPK